MRAQEFIFERQTVPFQGIDMSLTVEKDDDYVDDDDADNQLIHVRAMSGGRELGHVLFTQDYDSQGLVLNPQDLEVDERYRGQGIAAAMYDYVKSQGYKIRRSGQQTDAGAGFWAKHRPDSNVWEQGVAEGLFGIEDKIKGRIQNIISDLSDIPGMWDHKRQTFTDTGMEKLKSALKNNPKYIKYALNLTYKDYEAEDVAEGSVTKKPQPYNDPNWAKKLPKEKLNALAGPRYKKDTKEQGVREGIDPYRLERLDPQTRRVLIRMGDHKEPGSWLSASEAYAMSLGLQYKNRDPRGWEQDVQRYVDLYRQYSGQGVTEVKILSKVKGKGANPDQLPNRGREISPEKIQQLGRKVMDIDKTHSVYRDQFGGQITYNLFNTETNRSTLTVFGSRYPGNPDSFIVSGLYASPDNTIPAAEFYRRLITDLGLTLVSDRKQSPGGQRVWQRLEQLPGVQIHGYDTATGEVLNIGAEDEEMYAVPAAAAQGRDMARVARDIRLVATAR